jgi:hypothetical protein
VGRAHREGLPLPPRATSVRVRSRFLRSMVPSISSSRGTAEHALEPTRLAFSDSAFAVDITSPAWAQRDRSAHLQMSTAEGSPIRSLPMRFRQVRHCWPAPPYGHCLSLQELPSLLRWSLHCHCGPEGASRHHEERLLKVVQVLEAQQAWLLRQVRLQPVWGFRSVAVRLHFCGIAQ